MLNFCNCTLSVIFKLNTSSFVPEVRSIGPICIRILPSEVETRQQSSSEMMIPVLELLALHFGKGHVSELNILNNIFLMHP